MSRLSRLVCIALLASCGAAFAGEDADGRRAILEIKQRIDALASAVGEFNEVKRTTDQVGQKLDAWKKPVDLGAAIADTVKQ